MMQVWSTQAIFTVMDTDENGTLDKQEFMEVVESLMQFTGKPSHSRIARSGRFSASKSECAADSAMTLSLHALSLFMTDGAGVLLKGTGCVWKTAALVLTQASQGHQTDGS